MPIAPETIVAPPSSGPPLNGLLTSGLVVEDDSRWESGFTFAPECTGSAVWEPCADPAYEERSPAEKSEFEGNPEFIVYKPWIVEAPYECSSWGFIEAEYEAKAFRALESSEGQVIEREWWTGERMPANQNLRYFTPNDDDHILNPGGAAAPVAVGPGLGIVLLEAAIASCAHTKGVLHLPVSVAARVTGSMVLEDTQDGVLRTRTRGDLVVVGSGYDGSVGPIGQDPVSDGQAWAYVTGPVAVRLVEVEIFPETMAEALDRATNTISYRAERTAAVVHDACCSFAVLIELDQVVTVEVAP
jgi:hypothetical protein